MSRILVDQIRSNSASADAITLDGSGNLTIPGNATCSGTATGFGKILQVVHVENNDYGAQDSSPNTKYDSLSFGCQITPTSTSSTIMLWYSITLSAEVAERELTLTPTVNDGSSTTEFAQGQSSGSKVRINASDIATERNSSSVTISFHCKHSPSTTSQRTYGFRSVSYTHLRAHET